MPSSIHHYFEAIPDPRCYRIPKYPLINIILIALCAVIAGAEDWVSIYKFGVSKREWLSKWLDLSSGIPSHDTFSRVFSLLDSKAFGLVFIEWVKSISHKLKGVVALDGKAMRGTRKEAPWSALHIVSGWCSENQLSLGQVQVSDKSNEITAIPLLLELLDVKGASVTIDAMGCQKEISHAIGKKGAHYVLALKGNQGLLHEEIAYYFTTEEGKGRLVSSEYVSTLEKGHGRIEQREYYATDKIDWLAAEGWCDLTSIVMVKSLRLIKGVESIERRFYISDLPARHIKDISEATRTHWHVENKLHWQVDVSFNEDKWLSKIGDAAVNMALINKVALNLVKQEQTAKVGVKNKRLMAGWDDSYMEKIIFNAI